MSIFVQVVGVVGVMMINVAYYLISTGRMYPDRYLYPAINFVGASLILLAIVPEWNLPAFLMELSWALISLAAVLRRFFLPTKQADQRTPE